MTHGWVCVHCNRCLAPFMPSCNCIYKKSLCTNHASPIKETPKELEVNEVPISVPYKSYCMNTGID